MGDDAATEGTTAGDTALEYHGILPVPRVDRTIRKRYASRRVSPGVAVYTTAAIERVFSEVILSAKAEATHAKKKRITREHVVAAIRTHPSLARLFRSYTFVPTAKLQYKASDLLTKSDREMLKKIQESKKSKTAGRLAPAVPAVDEE